MDHEVSQELLALEALGALDGEDARALRAHLETCAECRAEADELRDTAAMLAHTVAPVRPPEELRARILSQINAPAAGEASEPPGAEVGGSNVLPFEKPHRMVLLSAPLLTGGAIAASLLVVALASALFLQWQRNRDLRAELARAKEQSGRMAASAEEMSRELARAREMNELVAAPEARTASLAGTKFAPEARARVTFDSRTGRALLLAYNLPPAPAGKVYQLWFIKDNRPPFPGKGFRTDDAGRASMSDQAPDEARDAATFAVTLEPEPGRPAPTGEIYLVGKVS